MVFLVKCPFLARMDIGASQHLNIIRGVEIESVAKIVESICQEVFSCPEAIKRERKANIAVCAIALGHSLFWGIMAVVKAIPVVINISVIIFI